MLCHKSVLKINCLVIFCIDFIANWFCIFAHVSNIHAKVNLYRFYCISKQFAIFLLLDFILLRL